MHFAAFPSLSSWNSMIFTFIFRQICILFHGDFDVTMVNRSTGSFIFILLICCNSFQLGTFLLLCVFFIFSLAFICDKGELREDIALYARKLVYPEWKPINARALATYLYPYIVYISICRRNAIVGLPVNELPLWHGLYTSPYICNPLASALQFGAEWSVLLAHFIAVYISDTVPSPPACTLPPLTRLSRFIPAE